MSNGSVVYVERKTDIVAFGMWRDSSRRLVKRVLGPAWVTRKGDSFVRRGGSAPPGYLTPKDAHVRLDGLIREREATLPTRAARKGTTFRDAAQAWLKYGKYDAPRKWSASTVQDRRWTLGETAHIMPTFGDKALTDVTRASVEKWWRSLHAPPRPLSDRNANKQLTELRALFNWAGKQYGLAANPTDGIAKHPEQTSAAVDFYSPVEVEILIAAAATADDALAFRLAAYAGLRRGEVLSLRWSNIDVDRALILVNESISGGEDSPPKWGSGRTVPLAPQLAQALQGSRLSASDGDLVIADALGRKLDGRNLTRRCHEAQERAGLRRLRFHDLRHTFGTLAIDGGATLVQVREWLGHRDIRTTERYLHTKSRTSDAELLGQAFATH